MPNLRFAGSKKSIALLLVLLVVAVVLALELTNTTYFFHKKVVPATIPVAKPKSTSKEDKKSSSTKPNGGQDSATESAKVASPAGGGGSNLTLVQPYGNLVSNHFPGKDGTSTKEQSVCNTTPGAACYIQFTKVGTGEITKLPAQTVGSDGSTIWNWDANILTSGQWEIRAVASLNGQSKSATDSLKLSVQ